MSLLSEINKEYESIMHSDMNQELKDKKLSSLMDILEKKFNIPMIRDEEYEKRNRAVIALYRKIARSRSL